MKKEISYTLSILFIFIFSVFSLFNLLKRYAGLTFEHFLEVCRQTISNFLSSGTHYVGFFLAAVTTITTLIFFAKSVLSFIKTKKKLTKLSSGVSLSIPRKLKSVLERNDIQLSKIVVIDFKKDLAITADWLNPKIIISTNLIKKLTKKELEAVILHEYYHLQGKHPLLLVISEILSSTLFFMPVIKDLTRKLRTTLEKEADAFAAANQNTYVHLNFALAKLTSTNKFNHFPSFSKRVDYKIEKFSLIVTSVVFLIGVALFLLPTQSHAVYDSTKIDASGCNGDYQCVSHCLKENISSIQTMTSAFQTSITSFTY